MLISAGRVERDGNEIADNITNDPLICNRFGSGGQGQRGKHTPLMQTPFTHAPSMQVPFMQTLFMQVPLKQVPFTQQPFMQVPLKQVPFTQQPFMQESFMQTLYTQVSFAQVVIDERGTTKITPTNLLKSGC